MVHFSKRGPHYWHTQTDVWRALELELETPQFQVCKNLDLTFRSPFSPDFNPMSFLLYQSKIPHL